MKLPPEQEAIRAKCFHPSGMFVEFPIEDVEKSIPDRFEKIANKFPNRTAVQSGADVLTYARLNFMSNQIAHKVLSRLKSRGQPVALLFGHQPPIVAGILAVLKSANLYVPLDPSYPVDRLRYMIEDSTAKLILTDNEYYALARKLAPEGMEIININDLDGQTSGENLKLVLAPLNHAYIIYTSGSTGQRKGVLHNHSNVLYSVYIESNSLHICTDDRIGLLHSFSSSASTKFLFAALLNGATLLPFDVKGEGLERLRLWLNRQDVTFCAFTASLFRSLTHSLVDSGNCPSLRLIILGSEAVTADDVALYKRFFHSQSTLVISFATSETATIRNYFVSPTANDYGEPVPVGYPIEGKSISLLDDTGNPVDPGDVGEIAVKSPYLAVGYWRQPDLTKAKFLPDPNGREERIYLTGDLGRLNSDGCLFHLGRKDNRVKIRGFTVEPLEVEQFLLRHPMFEAVAVVGRRLDSGEQHLVAYYVPALNAAPTTDELARFMRASLPSYMVPSKFVMIDALPLTPNGKVDRLALPATDRSRPKLGNQYSAPRNSVEATLAAIWAEVIDICPIGINDNFFDLGGHSLAATRVVSRVIEQFQLEIPLQSLFESPTIADMAAVITVHRERALDENELATILDELESLSDDEVQSRMNKSNSRIANK